MGGSKGKNSAKSGNWSQFDQKIPKFQQDALTKLYAQASNLFGQNNAAINRQVPGQQNFAQNVQNQARAAWQDQLAGGAYKNVNAGQIANQLNQSLNTPSQMSTINSMIMGGKGNNYADAMKGQYIKDANRAQQLMLNNLDARASAAGMGGGARHGVATAMGMNDINSNLQRNLAETGYNTFDKDLERKLGIAQQADQNVLARQGMLQNMLGAKQNTMAGAASQSGNVQNLGMGSFAPLMMPWQGMSNYGSILGGPTVLSSGQSQGNSSAKGKSASGGIGGGK